MGAEQKTLLGCDATQPPGLRFSAPETRRSWGKSYARTQEFYADYILSVIRQAVLKETGRGATVPAALKFIPQYAAAAISLCEYSHPRKQKAAVSIFLP